MGHLAANPEHAARASPTKATAMLVMTTLLWGLSFPLMKNWQNAAQDCPGGAVIASLTIIALRGVATAWGAGTGAWWAWTASMVQSPPILRDFLLLTVFCTVLAFHWMSVYQPQLTASRAALIYLLEPVFGAAFSIVRGHDPLTARLLLGGTLILGGNLLVELPAWLREVRKKGAFRS